MKNMNKLTYGEIELIIIALKDRADSEEAYGNDLWHRGDEAAAAPHYEEATECDRIIAKLREFEF